MLYQIHLITSTSSYCWR